MIMDQRNARCFNTLNGIINLQYLTNNKHTKHIKHYVRNCSLGDWFVLYQMSRLAPVIVLNNLFLIIFLIINN